MNQILSEEKPQNKKRRTSKTSLHSNVVVFAIILIIFGIGMTSVGAYSYFSNSSNNENSSIANTKTEPLITIERESATVINIVVTHDKQIANITYSINGGESKKVEGNGTNGLKEEVELPVGESNITITAQDINGVTSSYQSTYQVEQKPTITLEQVDNKIQVTTESKINIDYIKYYWDEDEQNARQDTINDVKNVTLIDVLEGMHTLNIKVVDIEGNETIKSQKVKGDNKPNLKVTTDKKSFIIKASDDENLSKIEITFNSGEKQTEEINAKEYSKNIELQTRINTLIVTVYNENGLSETSRVKYTKE